MIVKDRVWKIRVAGIEFDALDVDFQIEKTVHHEPNRCSLTIYNLSAESRALIEQLNIYDPKKSSTPLPRGNVSASVRAAKTGNIRVEIEAGYRNASSLLFRGDLRRGISTKEGPTWKTVIEGEDGGKSVLSSRVSASFPKGTPKATVVRTCAEAMGVGRGNILEVADKLSGTFSTGTVLDGSAADELRGVLRRCGLTYSVQNGLLQFKRTGKGVARRFEAVLVSEETGMIGNPERDATGELKVTCLLIPNLAPGGYIMLKSNLYKGVYQIVGVVHRGQTKGTDWYHILSVVPG